MKCGKIRKITKFANFVYICGIRAETVTTFASISVPIALDILVG